AQLAGVEPLGDRGESDEVDEADRQPGQLVRSCLLAGAAQPADRGVGVEAEERVKTRSNGPERGGGPDGGGEPGGGRGARGRGRGGGRRGGWGGGGADAPKKRQHRFLAEERDPAVERREGAFVALAEDRRVRLVHLGRHAGCTPDAFELVDRESDPRRE